jgi:glycine cleavage system H protein
MYPDDLSYSPEHHWVRLEGDTARIGITFFAQEQMRDIVYVDLPAVGDAVRAGQSYGTMESVKAVSDINSPLTGEVIEVNDSLDDAPQQMNRDPYGAGWTIRLRLVDPAETARLIDKAAYIKIAEDLAAKRKRKVE